MISIGKIKINKNEQGYLIHGQPFSLQFDFNETKWGLVFSRPGIMSANQHKTRNYKPGSSIWGFNLDGLKYFKLIKSTGEIQLISNAYYPYIKIYLFSSFFNFSPTKLKLPLKINFINTRELNTHHDFYVHPLTPSSKINPDFITLKQPIVQIQVNIPQINLNEMNFPELNTH